MKFKISLIYVFVLAAGLGAQGAQVVLKSSDVHISSDKIYLGDIADFTDTAPKDLEKLQAIYIKKAAVPGFKVVVEKEYVVNKLSRYLSYVNVEGPSYVNVYTSKGSVSREDVEKIARDYVLSNMPWKLDAADVKVKQVKGTVPVLEGTVLLKVKDEGSFSYKGNLVIPVEIHVDGRYYRTEPVSMVVRVNAPCAVAQTDISRHAVIPQGSVSMETKDITYLPDIIIPDLTFLNNKTPVRNILNGTILTWDMFESLPLFRRGSLVDVIVKIRAIRVQSEGTALSDGREGEAVRVKLSTGKTVDGKVDASGKVIIEK